MVHHRVHHCDAEVPVGHSDGDIPYMCELMSLKLTEEVWLEIRIGRNYHLSENM